MRRSTPFQSVQKTSFIATLVILPMLVFFSGAANAAVRERTSKMPSKAGATFYKSNLPKPLSNKGKAALNIVYSSDFSDALDTYEASNIVVSEGNLVQSDYSSSNGLVLPVDMVLLPQPLNRFTL